MRNKRVKITLITVGVTAIILCVIVLANNFVKEVGTSQRKSLREMFFKSSDKRYIEKLIDKNGQKYNVDDYTITLEETLYDRRANIGYCVFAITKEGGNQRLN